MKGCTNIVTVLHGSHLYGLNTENSDKDFKSVFFKPFRDVVLGKGPENFSTGTGSVHEKNTKDDTDHMHFSLKSFFQMLSKGEMVAMDLIHSPNTHWVGDTHHVWSIIQRNRDLFYCRDMRAYLGYCRKQSAKYGIKGSRVAALREALDAMSLVNENCKFKLIEIRNDLPEGEFLIKRETGYEILGKLHQWTVNAFEVKERAQKAFDEYGHRALLAEQNEGVDFKAVSHAFRAGYQLLDLFQKGTMILPLSKEVRNIILPIKLGQLDFKTQIQPDLERLMDKVEAESKKANLPEFVDQDKVDELLICVYEHLYGVKFK
jgi:hypothetical protein